MYDTVLVPTDGSDHAIRAAEHGYYMARRFDADVHVLNVVDVEGAAGMFDAGGVDDRFVGRLEREGERSVETVRAAIGDESAVTTALVEGEPSDAILEYATANDADLIAMGTHGRTGVHRYVAGSVTEAVVRRADVPVLTARATDRSRLAGDYRDILLPFDGSDPAEAAVDHALELATRTGGTVHAVHVVDPGLIAAPADSASARIVDELEAAGESMTERIADRARDRGVDAATAVRNGVPASVLLDYADEHDVDLVAMGTAGRTGVNRYLLGSTTERIIRHAEVPVVAINARESVQD